jgi:hypothetical protein
VKTAGFTGMASRPFGLNMQEKTISIAVGSHADDLHHIARSRTLAPKLTSTPRPKMDLPGFQCLREALSIHVGDHHDSPILDAL